MEPDGRPETADAHAPGAIGGVIFRHGVVSHDALLGHAGTAGRVTAEEFSGSEWTVTEYLVAEAPKPATAIAACVLASAAGIDCDAPGFTRWATVATSSGRGPPVQNSGLPARSPGPCLRQIIRSA